MKRLFTCLFCFYSLLASGQAYIFKNYNRVEGLPQSQVTGITQDQYGNMWFSTLGGGISHYDGKNFCSITEGLESRFVYNIYADSNNNVWLIYPDGFGRFDGDSIINYLNIGLGRPNFFRVNEIAQFNDSTIYASSPEGGLIKFQNYEPYLVKEKEGYFNEDVYAIKNRKDSLAFVTAKAGIYHLTTKGLSLEEYPEKIRGSEVFDIEQISSTRFYSTKEGLFKHNLNSGSIKLLSDEWTWSLAVVDNQLWASARSGILRVVDDEILLIDERKGFTNDRLYDIYVDREENLWMGSNGHGVYKYTGDVFQYIDSSLGLEGDVVMTINGDDQGNIYFGTSTGLNYVSQKDSYVKSYYPEIYKARAITKSSKGFVWVADNDLIHKMQNGDIVQSIKIARQGYHFTARFMITDSNDNLIIASSNGLYKITDSGKMIFRKTTEDGLSNNFINFLYKFSDDSIAICTETGIDLLIEDKIIPFPVEEIANSSALSIAEFNEYLWFGLSENGILGYDHKKDNIIKIDEQAGLSSDLVYFMHAQGKENLWVGTGNGLDKISFPNLDSIATITHYNKEEGYFGIESNHHAVYEDVNGSLWFGTIGGAFKYNPSSDKMNDIEPITSLRGIKINYGRYKISSEAKSIDPWYNIPQNLRLPYSKNHITFSFLGSSMTHPERIKYKFKLEGFDDDWISGKHKNEAIYSNLPAGKYTFKVKASNSSDVWNIEATEYSFEILPPFWQTAWFIGGMVMIIGLTVFGTNRWLIRRAVIQNRRVEELKKEEIERTRKSLAMDFHDELGNELANILTYSNLLKFRLNGTDEKIRRALDNLSSSASHLLKGTREFIWSIDPKNDNLFEVLTYLKDFGEQLFSGSDQKFIINNHILSPEVDFKLPPGWSRQIVFIFKEAMTNCLKHSNACNVYFDVVQKEGKVHIKLQDDGCGVLNNRKSFDSNGLENMRRRSDKINSKLWIRNVNGTGTLVDLELVVPTKHTFQAA
ncbi:MAG: triple tyrosine motif-containing protein [Bacteroidota bacterium]